MHSPEFAARVREVKRRFASARSTLEGRARGEPIGLVDTGRALRDLLVLDLFEIGRLARCDEARRGPISEEIRAIAADVSAARRTMLRALPRFVSAPDETYGAVVGLLDADSRLLARLTLLGRAPLPDWFGGLDTAAAFPSFRYSASNRGRVPRFCEESPAEPVAWRNRIGGMIWPSALVDSAGDLYLGHADSEIVSLHPSSEDKWRLRDSQMMYVDSTGALGRDGFLYMASTDTDSRGHQNQGRIWKLDPGTGEVVWTFWGRHFEDPERDPQAHLSSFMEGNVALSEEDGALYVYAGSDDNRLYKLDATGQLVWEYDVEAYPSGIIWTKPLFDPDCSTVFVGDLSGQVHAVRTRDGSRLWAVRLGGAVVSSIAFGLHGELFLGCFDGRVHALDPEDGSVLWAYQTLGLVYSSPAVTEDGSIVVGSSDGAVYCIDRFGRRRWSYMTSAPVKSSPVIDPEGNSYVGNQAGKIYCLAADGTRVWSYDTNPKLPENDINASPTLSAAGTVYVGSSTGELFAIDRGYCEAHAFDPSVCLDPGEDGTRPDIPPGGAVLVYLDRFGTPVFEGVPAVGLADNLNFALFAVDENVDVVASELLSEGLDVRITPEIDFDARPDSMGRYLYVVPGELLAADTAYEICVSARYRAQGETRVLETNLRVPTTAVTGEDDSGLVIGEEAVSAFVVHGARAAMPKEIDAVGQAMIDSQNFIVAPLHIDTENRRFVVAVVWAHQRGDAYEYQAATVNKMVVPGVWRDGYMRFGGPFHLVAQGINMEIDTLAFGGRVVPGSGLTDGSASLVAPVTGIPEFTDLLRGMRLADARDETVGFLTFDTAPWEGAEARRPRSISAELWHEGDTVVADIHMPDGDMARHWLHMVFYDSETGRTVDASVPDSTTDSGSIGMRIPIPEGMGGASTVVILVFDLFPLAKLTLGRESRPG